FPLWSKPSLPSFFSILKLKLPPLFTSFSVFGQCQSSKGIFHCIISFGVVHCSQTILISSLIVVFTLKKFSFIPGTVLNFFPFINYPSHTVQDLHRHHKLLP